MRDVNDGIKAVMLMRVIHIMRRINMDMGRLCDRRGDIEMMIRPA